MYNLEKATKAFIQSASYLARDLDFDSDNPPTEKQVASWRSSAMMIVAQHKGAHREITRLRQRVAELEAAKKLCRSDFEKWISNPPYEHMCDRNRAKSAWPGQYKRYETQLAWEAWKQALSIDAAMAGLDDDFTRGEHDL